MKKIFYYIIYWFIQLTWGALLTIPGLLITGFCIVFLKGKPHKNGLSYIVEVGGNWGGVEIGAVALCGNYSTSNPYWYEHTRKHEFGHTLQQIMFGPFQLFIVGIPSAIRYWYDRLEKKHASERDEEWYDSVWFEGTATKWGTKFIDKWEGKVKDENRI